MRPIRNAAKAIIIQNGQLLAIRNRDQQGDYYILPGGGQDHGETLHEALRRECKEEIGVDIIAIGDLRFIREYIGAHHEFAEHDSDAHTIELMFLCEIEEGYIPVIGTMPDEPQTGVRWLPLLQLDQYSLYPAVLKTLLKEEIDTASWTYLGDIN